MSDSNRLDDLLKTREQVWDEHPVISAHAALPTPPVLSATKLIKKAARRQRGSIAFWANPLTGKSSCIRLIEIVLPRDLPGCGVFVYEAKKKDVIAEGTFLEDILSTMDYEPKVQRSLAGKRDQVVRALYALAAPRQHLFIVIDEAQELLEQELCWLKFIINWLIRHSCRVTVVLFGQQELCALRDSLVSSARSDLDIRYTKEMYEFENIFTVKDLEETFAVCDAQSEFPIGTGWSYTQFLWPIAFENGFRLARQAPVVFTAFIELSPQTKGSRGLSMQWVASAVAELADATRESDRASFCPTLQDWKEAIKSSGYIDFPPVLRKKSGNQ